MLTLVSTGTERSCGDVAAKGRGSLEAERATLGGLLALGWEVRATVSRRSVAFKWQGPERLCLTAEELGGEFEGGALLVRISADDAAAVDEAAEALSLPTFTTDAEVLRLLVRA